MTQTEAEPEEPEEPEESEEPEREKNEREAHARYLKFVACMRSLVRGKTGTQVAADLRNAPSLFFSKSLDPSYPTDAMHRLADELNVDIFAGDGDDVAIRVMGEVQISFSYIENGLFVDSFPGTPPKVLGIKSKKDPESKGSKESDEPEVDDSPEEDEEDKLYQEEDELYQKAKVRYVEFVQRADLFRFGVSASRIYEFAALQGTSDHPTAKALFQALDELDLDMFTPAKGAVTIEVYLETGESREFPYIVDGEFVTPASTRDAVYRPETPPKPPEVRPPEATRPTIPTPPTLPPSTRPPPVETPDPLDETPSPPEPLMANLTAPEPPSPFTLTMSEMKDAAITGAKAGAASTIAFKCADFVVNRLKVYPWFPAWFANEFGRKALAVALPPAIYYLTLLMPERIPNAEGVRAAAKYAMLGHSVMLVAPIMAELSDLFGELGELAKKEGLDAAKKENLTGPPTAP